MSTVLVVDDDPALLRLTQEVLSAASFRVLTAENGSDALAVLVDESVDLILLDMRMPVMDGWEFARTLRGRAQSETPIVIITAGMNPGATAREIGAQGYVSKPFDIDHLIHVVEEQVAPPPGRS